MPSRTLPWVNTLRIAVARACGWMALGFQGAMMVCMVRGYHDEITHLGVAACAFWLSAICVNLWRDE